MTNFEQLPEYGLSKAKSQKGVAQKQKWLEEAKSDMAKFEKELAKAKEQLEALTKAAEKKDKAANYAIEFEKEFQFMMMVAEKDLGKKAVLESLKNAIERFDKGMDVPGPEQAPAVAPRTAGLLDFLSGALVKAWEYLKGAFDFFVDWVADLGKTTKDIEKLLSEAGAGE